MPVKHYNIILKHGKDILESDGMKTEKRCIQHGTYTVFDHSLAVTSMCISISKKLRINVHERELVRGALLHDFFLYDWHERSLANSIHGFTHPGIALRNAEKVLKLGKIERNMIRRHMFPLTPIPPRYRESVILCIADKMCATKETVSGFRKKFNKKLRRVHNNA